MPRGGKRRGAGRPTSQEAAAAKIIASLQDAPNPRSVEGSPGVSHQGISGVHRQAAVLDPTNKFSSSKSWRSTVSPFV
jgi:hypothetical protein